MESDPASICRGLPLSPEQDSEIRHHIHGRQRCGLPWETPELRAMVADMLDPPEVSEEEQQSLSDSMHAERGALQDDDEGVTHTPRMHRSE
ncbi:hypothetical protein [Massilia sp. GCM10023247]|uniref:hypothetical protein n=1 Tax=Massilia sp. GCM10023247 TaxID=3252643 RepID=UPI00360ECEB9